MSRKEKGHGACRRYDLSVEFNHARRPTSSSAPGPTSAPTSAPLTAPATTSAASPRRRARSRSRCPSSRGCASPRRSSSATNGARRRSRRPSSRCTWPASPQVQIDPLVEGYGVAVATGLPVAGHAGLYQQPLALIVVVGCHLVRQRGARAHDAHPFCQDEKTRLPAEMIRLDSRTTCFLEFEPPDFCGSFRPSLTMNQLRKAAFKSNSKSSHWDRFPMGRFFASTSTHTQTQRVRETANLNKSRGFKASTSNTGLARS